MATFMSAAYNEHRFRNAKYEADINSYKNVYEGIKRREHDKSLVFKNWLNPTRDDRNLVYFKGAYVLHLLREEMGEDAFWKVIKLYSQKYFEKTVQTADFLKIMQDSSDKKLTPFFSKWGYNK